MGWFPLQEVGLVGRVCCVYSVRDGEGVCAGCVAERDCWQSAIVDWVLLWLTRHQEGGGRSGVVGGVSGVVPVPARWHQMTSRVQLVSDRAIVASR